MLNKQGKPLVPPITFGLMALGLLLMLMSGIMFYSINSLCGIVIFAIVFILAVLAIRSEVVCRKRGINF